MKPNHTSPYRICFVCLGNIVRSPLAENLFRQLAEDRGVGGRFAVDSAGTANYHAGDSPDSRMRAVASRRGLDYDGRGRQFKREDFSRFDLIVPMDLENREDLESLAQSQNDRSKIHLLREFDPLSGGNESVPDPYYGPIEGFEAVFDIIDRSCRSLLEAFLLGDLPASGN
ncbi:MAG TPA: low molecular weight protein-tyrosine-phosphatase [Anaerolineales bacterium]|nr:low molecular weight protein-tyrosine-phosphatase [Anaerolineales bacterium]